MLARFTGTLFGVSALGLDEKEDAEKALKEENKTFTVKNTNASSNGSNSH